MNNSCLLDLSFQDKNRMPREGLAATATRGGATPYQSLYEVSVAQQGNISPYIAVNTHRAAPGASLSSIATDINDRLNRRYSREEKQQISGRVADWLHEQGRLLVDTSNADAPVPYMVLDDGRAISLNAVSQAAKLAIADAGINMTEKVFSWTFADLQHRCLREGTPVFMKEFTEYQNGKWYISSGSSQMVIAEKLFNDYCLTVAPNGTDGIWFRAECCLHSWVPTQDIMSLTDIAAFQPTLEAPSETKVYTGGIQTRLLECWIVSVLMRVRPLPILVNLGQYASGKSLLAKAIIKLFEGASGDMSTTPCTARDFVACATSQLLYGLDNLDGVPEKWLPDLLAQTSTGSTVKERMLYTNGEVYVKPLLSAVLITTRTAAFASRQDILDRTLPLFFGTRRNFPLSERELLDAVVSNRDALLSGLAVKMAEVKSWNIQNAAADNRFTDFGRVVYLLYPEHAEKMLAASYRAKRTSINDDDSLLQAFLRFEGNVLHGNATQIVKMLDPDGERVKYMGGGQKIARALREIIPTLQLNGWKIEDAKGHGTTIFRFSRPEDGHATGSTTV